MRDTCEFAAETTFRYRVLKRAVDLLMAAAALVLVAPAMLLIAALTWLRSGRPLWLAQERVGRGGGRFVLYKFRTLPLCSLKDKDHCWVAAPTDGWGRFLRNTGLDELPQLWNVLRGDMSLVGPRPERPYFVERFEREFPLYASRHRLRPGITGWAQVNGWRGNTSIPRRVAHDLSYLRHWSLAFDLRILGITLLNFVRQLWEPAAALASGAPDARSV